METTDESDGRRLLTLRGLLRNLRREGGRLTSANITDWAVTVQTSDLTAATAVAEGLGIIHVEDRTGRKYHHRTWSGKLNGHAVEIAYCGSEVPS